jgi:uncharacterized protein involved in exopolysaccharide biosynthesis
MSTPQEPSTSASIEKLSQARLKPELFPLFLVIWPRRWWLAKITGCGMLAALIVAFIIPKQYQSTAQLMPPEPTAFSGGPLMATLLGENAPSAAAGLASSLVGARTPGATFVGVLESRTVADEIIRQFNLLHVYHAKYLFQARKELAKRSVISEDRKSGMISIAVTDTDPSRARQIAQAYIDDLNSLASRLSSSGARRERIFLEGRLSAIQKEMDSAEGQLSKFSSQNATLNIQDQGKATLDAVARLQGELIAAEGNLQSLKAIYSADNVRVQAAQARVVALRNSLYKLGGLTGSRGGPGKESDEIFPSLRALPILGVKYYDLYRRVAMLETVYQILDKEYEIARVEEAKEAPSIKVLDQPNFPEKKSFPPRLLITILGMLLSTAAGMGWIIGAAFWNQIEDSHPVKQWGKELARYLKIHASKQA